jgi:hypothetical protein
MYRSALIAAVLLAACGDDDPVRHLDGGIDSKVSDVDAPNVQPVTLTITSDGEPQAGVRVYFQNPDSSLISNTLTDESGVATALMPNGGFVTSIDAFGTRVPAGGPRREVHIYAGVKPGDHLNLTDPGFDSQTVTITGPIDTTAGVTNYEMSSPCGRMRVANPGSAGGPPVWNASLDRPCPTTDFLLTSLDDANQIVHWAYVPNVTVGETIDLSEAALTNSPTTKTYSLDNAEAWGSQAYVRQVLASSHGAVEEFLNIAFDPNINLLLATSIGLPSFPNAIDIVDVSAAPNVDAEHHLLDWGAFATSYTVDVAARALPEVSEPIVDPALHQLTWTQAIGGASPDFVTARASVSRSEPSFRTWQVWLAAPAGTAIGLPTLPTDVADLNINEADDVFVSNLNLGKVPGGYDAVRANIFDLAFAVSDGRSPTTFITSASGSATLELWAPRGRLARTAPQKRVLTGRTH